MTKGQRKISLRGLTLAERVVGAHVYTGFNHYTVERIDEKKGVAWLRRVQSQTGDDYMRTRKRSQKSWDNLMHTQD